ncbi:MAG: DUF3971 domain-containing protein [Oricola sp.]
MLLAVPLLLLGLLRSGLFAPIIEREAVASLARVLPDTVIASIGDASVGVSGFDGIGVSLGRFALTDKQSGDVIFAARDMRIGVRTLSALRGKPQIRHLSLSGIDVKVPKLAGGDGDLPPIARLDSGLDLLFDSASRLFDETTINGAPVGIDVKDMRLSGPGGPDGGIVVKSALVLARSNQRALEAEVVFGGHPVAVAAMLRRTKAGAVTVSIRADKVPLPFGQLRTILSAVEADHLPDAAHEPVYADFNVTARRKPGGGPDALTFNIEPDHLSLKLDTGDFIDLSGRLNFEWAADKNVLSLLDSPVRFGRSSGVLSGGIRDAPEGERAGDGRNYQFELVLNNGISNPLDSPEPPVEFAARAQGVAAPRAGLTEFSRIEIKSAAGYAEGAGTLDFAAAVPNAVFAISIRDFALAGVKQFWPGSVARAARRWVLENLAGGRVSEGEFLIAEPLRRRVAGTDEKLEGDTELSLRVEGVRFDVAGDIPPVRDAVGKVDYKHGEATITLDSGTAYLPSGRTAAASNGTLVIHPQEASGTVFADLDVEVSGAADALGELISFRPISAKKYRDYKAEDLSGDVDAHVTMHFALNPQNGVPAPDWNVVLNVRNAAVAQPFEGRMLSDMTGRIEIDRERAEIDVTGRIDGLPADIAMIQPFGGGPLKPIRDIVLKLDNEDRDRIAPGLDPLIDGVTSVKVKTQGGGDKTVGIDADLTAATLSLPWIGWTKGSGIAARTRFDLLASDAETRISDFRLDGGTFAAKGDIVVGRDGLQRARFSGVRLNETDNISVAIDRKGRGYAIAITGQSFDARALIRHIRKEMNAKDGGDGTPVELTARIGKVRGFGDETLHKLDLTMRHDGKDLTELTVSAMTASGFPVSFRLSGAGAARTVSLEALGGGALLRFLDIYGQIRGGVLTMTLTGSGPDRLTGKVDLNDFRIFNEPRLNALVSSKAANSASLNEAIQRKIDTREIKFDRASATLDVGPSSLRVTNAIVRGAEVGATFQGTVYDRNNQMRISGTFMPAYAVNSLLSNLPVIGLVLGNGRDRALIGVTFLLEGDAKKPKITVNPLSAIAPGLFRSIFEFR